MIPLLTGDFEPLQSAWMAGSLNPSKLPGRKIKTSDTLMLCELLRKLTPDASLPRRSLLLLGICRLSNRFMGSLLRDTKALSTQIILALDRQGQQLATSRPARFEAITLQETLVATFDDINEEDPLLLEDIDDIDFDSYGGPALVVSQQDRDLMTLPEISPDTLHRTMQFRLQGNNTPALSLSLGPGTPYASDMDAHELSDAPFTADFEIKALNRDEDILVQDQRDPRFEQVAFATYHPTTDDEQPVHREMGGQEDDFNDDVDSVNGNDMAGGYGPEPTVPGSAALAGAAASPTYGPYNAPWPSPTSSLALSELSAGSSHNRRPQRGPMRDKRTTIRKRILRQQVEHDGWEYAYCLPRIGQPHPMAPLRLSSLMGEGRCVGEHDPWTPMSLPFGRNTKLAQLRRHNLTSLYRRLQQQSASKIDHAISATDDYTMGGGDDGASDFEDDGGASPMLDDGEQHQEDPPAPGSVERGRARDTPGGDRSPAMSDINPAMPWSSPSFSEIGALSVERVLRSVQEELGRARQRRSRSVASSAASARTRRADQDQLRLGRARRLDFPDEGSPRSHGGRNDDNDEANDTFELMEIDRSTFLTLEQDAAWTKAVDEVSNNPDVRDFLGFIINQSNRQRKRREAEHSATDNAAEAPLVLQQLFPPQSTTRRVFARAFRNTLHLASSGLLDLQQLTSFGDLTLSLVEPEPVSSPRM